MCKCIMYVRVLTWQREKILHERKAGKGKNQKHNTTDKGVKLFEGEREKKRKGKT